MIPKFSYRFDWNGQKDREGYDAEVRVA